MRRFIWYAQCTSLSVDASQTTTGSAGWSDVNIQSLIKSWRAWKRSHSQKNEEEQNFLTPLALFFFFSFWFRKRTLRHCSGKLSSASGACKRYICLIVPHFFFITEKRKNKFPFYPETERDGEEWRWQELTLTIFTQTLHLFRIIHFRFYPPSCCSSFPSSASAALEFSMNG